MRKQAAVTLRCMQALVRVQARVRARRVRMSVEGQAVQKMLDERHANEQILKQAEVYIIYICVCLLLDCHSICRFSNFSIFRKDGVIAEEPLRRLRQRYR